MPIIKPATVSLGAPQQFKQPSRKGKKAWRKNVDVTEIQEGLEEVRDELIKGYDPNLALNDIFLVSNLHISCQVFSLYNLHIST
jgi:hypothetical protein